MKCGLLGRKLSHSYSPQIHGYFGNPSYTLLEIEPEELEGFLRNSDYTGLNVTVPYKKSVLPFLDELSPVAQKLGAVNTIVRRNDKLIGHNTDYFGFQTMVQASGLNLAEKKVLVLGSGGASNTVTAVLKDMDARPIVISRTGEYNYQNLHLHADARAIVNTTPVGMYPNTGISPVDLELFPKLEGVLDVVYNPARTQLLLDAECRKNLVAMNGLLMLVAQAKESVEWFTENQISDDQILKIYKILSAQMQNLVLIGMPGCGKSTIGKLLAERLGKTFVDADKKIVELSGKTIPEIFAKDGEEAFRKWETEVLSQLGKQSSLVIATGGGCVTKEHNYHLLHQNGTILWLKRDWNTLPTEGRPLSTGANLQELYNIRQPMYEYFADLTVDNNITIEQSISNIVKRLEVNL